MTPARSAEIAREARDLSHLMPDPVATRADCLACTACGATLPYPSPLPVVSDWLAVHRGEACARGLDDRMARETSEPARRVLGAVLCQQQCATFGGGTA